MEDKGINYGIILSESKAKRYLDDCNRLIPLIGFPSRRVLLISNSACSPDYFDPDKLMEIPKWKLPESYFTFSRKVDIPRVPLCIREPSEFPFDMSKLSLGSGGFGQVQTTSYGACKTFRHVLGEYDSVIRECNLLLSIRHRHLMHASFVYHSDPKSSGELEVGLCMPKALMDLRKWWESLSPRAREIMYPEVKRQLIIGLYALHKAGIVHRDLKSTNVLVMSTSPLLLKISDFGSSLYLEGRSTVMTGTVSACAPEILHAQSLDEFTIEYGKEIDVWALGILLWRLIDSKWCRPGENPKDHFSVLTSIFNFHGTVKPEWSKSYDWSSVPKTSIMDTSKSREMDVISKILQWNPSKRPKIEDLVDKIDRSSVIKFVPYKMKPLTKRLSESTLAKVEKVMAYFPSTIDELKRNDARHWLVDNPKLLRKVELLTKMYLEEADDFVDIEIRKKYPVAVRVDLEDLSIFGVYLIVLGSLMFVTSIHSGDSFSVYMYLSHMYHAIPSDFSIHKYRKQELVTNLMKDVFLRMMIAFNFRVPFSPMDSSK